MLYATLFSKICIPGVSALYTMKTQIDIFVELVVRASRIPVKNHVNFVAEG